LNWPAVGWVTTTLASENTLPPPTGTSDAGPRTVPPLVLAGALEDGAVLVGAELVPVAGAELEPLLPLALSLPPQAARIGALAPARAAIAAQRSTDLRSRRLFPSGVCCGVVGAIVSSLMNLDLQEPAGRSG
jgi:hypothetical protein